MSKYDDVTLSTSTTIIRHERELIALSQTGDWADKIALAKEMLKVYIEQNLINQNLKEYVDYDDGEEPIDLINNAEILVLSSDFLTLSLIYQDLSHGKTNSGYYSKHLTYQDMFRQQLDLDMQRVNLDLDNDTDTDIDRADFGSGIRLER